MIFHACEQGGRGWKREAPGQVSVSGGGVKAIRESFSSLFQQQAHRKLCDWDDHLDDLSKDPWNPSLAGLGKMALPGQMR
jgi:hypothetical protein